MGDPTDCRRESYRSPQEDMMFENSIQRQARFYRNNYHREAGLQDPSWRSWNQSQEVRDARRCKYKTAGRLARLVIAARDVAVTISMDEASRQSRADPDRSPPDFYVYRCVEEHFLPTLNAWRKEQVRYFRQEPYYTNLASSILGRQFRNSPRNRDPIFVAERKACHHACFVVHHVHLAIFAMVTGKDYRPEAEKALEELAQVMYHATLREGKEANLDEIRAEVKICFAI
jgi:hypothetical protein